MTGFVIITTEGIRIRFKYYIDAAPITAGAFHASLPFRQVFLHARTSGEEIWTAVAPALDIIQENASVFCEPGEVVIGPLNPARARTVGCMGIYYGEGKGLDSCNIFGKVYDDDASLLQVLGESIWKNGGQELIFEALVS